MIVLPVSRRVVELTALTGMEDALLLESPDNNTAALAASLLSRTGRFVDGQAVGWEALPVTDADALLLHLRQREFGDTIRAESACRRGDCRTRLDVTLRVGDYLAHCAPTVPRGVASASEDGWFCLDNAPITFRIPTLGDQIAVAGQPEPAGALMARCVRPAPPESRLRKRVEAALESLAPGLDSILEAVCPECGATVQIAFEPRAFTLQELRGQAAFLYDDAHLLASRYHWREADILALPRARRCQYAERIRQSL